MYTTRDQSGAAAASVAITTRAQRADGHPEEEQKKKRTWMVVVSVMWRVCFFGGDTKAGVPTKNMSLTPSHCCPSVSGLGNNTLAVEGGRVLVASSLLLWSCRHTWTSNRGWVEVTSTVLSSQGIIQEAPIGIGDERMWGGSCVLSRGASSCRLSFRWHAPFGR